MNSVYVNQEEKLLHLKKAIRVLCGKWQFLVLCRLNQPLRFGALRRLIPDISEKMLIQTLRLLEENYLVTRHDFGEIPPRVEYRITESGLRSLKIVPILTDVVFPDEVVLTEQ